MSTKRNRAWAAGVVAICGCFAAAIGAGVEHFRVFIPQGFGFCENLFVAGNCAVSYDAVNDASTLTLEMRRLQPNTTYGVQLDGDGSGFSDPLAFTTDSYGRGSYTHVVAQDATPDRTCKVYIWDGDLDSIDVVTDMEVRAVGLPQGFLLNLLK